MWRANNADGQKRRWVLVQEPVPCNPTEKTGKKALAAGFETVFEITAERLRRASQALHGQLGADLGFRVFRSAATNLDLLPPVIADPSAAAPEQFVQESIAAALLSPLKPGVADDSVLWEVILKGTNLGLDTEVEELDVDGLVVYALFPSMTDEEAQRVYLSLGKFTPEHAEVMKLRQRDVVILRGDRVDDATTMTLAARCSLLLIDRVPGEVSL